MLSWSFVNSADFLMISDIFKTASIFMPAFEDAKFIDEQTLSVVARASGILSINKLSPFVHPFSTRAEKPPTKFTPTSFAALSKTCAILT
ncbi:unknown [Clostridium sp. CAG:813]|nr:unknown [Clostridium sp. CAG:813]